MTENDLKRLGELIGRTCKAAIDAATAPLHARIAELEGARGKLAPATIHLTRYDPVTGECLGELRQDGAKVSARAGSAVFTADGTINELSKQLIDFFVGVAR